MYLNLRKLNRLTFIDELSKNVRKYKTYFILMMDLKGFRHTQQKYLLIFSYYDILNKSVSFPIVIVLQVKYLHNTNIFINISISFYRRSNLLMWQGISLFVEKSHIFNVYIFSVLYIEEGLLTNVNKVVSY